MADAHALAILAQQVLDSDWFRVLTLLGTVAFALSGVVLAYSGGYTLVGALTLAALPAAGGGIVRDLILQRQPIGIVRDPVILLTIFCTVLLGKAFFRLSALTGAQRVVKSLQSGRDGGTFVIELCDALGLAAFIVIGVVAALDACVYPLWLWGPVSATITAAFGRIMRDLACREHKIAQWGAELYAEIAVIWGLGLSLFLAWQAPRAQLEEIRLAVVVTIIGAVLTRTMALKLGLKGWSYG